METNTNPCSLILLEWISLTLLITRLYVFETNSPKLQMPGYVLSESDRSGIAAKYLCSFCGCLLRDPFQTACGHCYCKSCLDNLLKNDSFQMQCLACGEFLSQDQVFPDKFMKREVLNLKVHCPYKTDGCGWQGEVREVEAHTSTCEYLKVSCPHETCGMMMMKSSLAKHLQSECICRMIKCKYCGEKINANVVDAHQDTVCSDFPIRCQNCHKCVQRSKLSDHQDAVRGDCEAVQGPCPFVQAGCPQTEVMNAQSRRKHLKENVVTHLTQLLAMFLQVSTDVQSLVISDASFGVGAAASGAMTSAIEATKSAAETFLNDSESTVKSLLSGMDKVSEENRDLRQKLRDQSERITRVERRTVTLGNSPSEGAGTFRSFNAEPAGTLQPEFVRRLANVENKAADHEILMVESCRSIEDVRHQNSYLQRQLEQAQESIRRLERRVESQDHMLALRNVALADLEEYIRQQEVSSYNGILLWKITDFAKKRNDAISGRQTSFYSACFYTSRHGYKMCARIYLNGDGMGKGSHISLFFVVMRGQYDALLRWPFRQKVTLMLLDQDNTEHVIDAFRPDPNSSSFQRPRREMNIASGCPLFSPLADLDKHAYVRDDTMFIKIIVDTSDL